jgi:hypothetical protein
MRRSCFRVAGTTTLVYVDGATFHAGSRLRRDRGIRAALREGSAGWRIVELKARDLGAPASVIRRVVQDGDFGRKPPSSPDGHRSAWCRPKPQTRRLR